MDISTIGRQADIAQPAQEPGGLWSRLKAGTQVTHERLDGRIMAGRPFESRERYGLFLQVQRDFHTIVSPLYHLADRADLLPGFGGRDRLALIEQDLRDLGLDVPAKEEPALDRLIDTPDALGWLYVAEGSNLGAAFLLKAARQLELSESFGARHLAPAPEGRGLHWKTFTAALDAIALAPQDEERVIMGANIAFARVLSFVDQRFIATATD